MEYKLTLSDEDIKLLDKALVELPYREVFQLINKLNEQIVEQEQGAKSEGNKTKPI